MGRVGAELNLGTDGGVGVGVVGEGGGRNKITTHVAAVRGRICMVFEADLLP